MIIVGRKSTRESLVVENVIVGGAENVKVVGHLDLLQITTVMMGSIGQRTGLVTIATTARSLLLANQDVENATAGEVVSVDRRLGNAPSAT